MLRVIGNGSQAADIPSAFASLLDVADTLGGEVMLFGPDEKIIGISENLPQRYPFYDFNDGGSFTDLYWAIVKNGMSTAESLRVSPEDYLTMILVSRRAHDDIGFRKYYPGVQLLCQHRRFPGGWNAQVRVEVDRLVRQAPWIDCMPLSVAEGVTAILESRRFEALLNALPIGVMLVSAGGEVSWCNHAARFSCGAIEGEALPVMPSSGGALSHSGLMSAISSAIHFDQTSYVRWSESSFLSVSKAPSGNGALVLAPPPAPTESVVREALGTLGLSPGLCRVALAVASSGGPAEVAKMSGRSTATIRKQLVNIYHHLGLDMGVTSQRALAQVIWAVASIARVPSAHNTKGDVECRQKVSLLK